MSKKIECTLRIIYINCFLFLCIINWGVGALDGRTQFILINLSGLPIAIIIFTGYNIRDLKKTIYIVWAVITIAVMPFLIKFGREYYPYRGQWVTGIINVCFYSLMAIVVLRKNLVERKISAVKWPIFFCWLGMILLMVLSKNESNWPLWFGAMFGSLYLTPFSERIRVLIYESLVQGIIVGFFVIQGAALLFRPYDECRYIGMFLNPNLNALMYIMSYIAFLCNWLILKNKGKAFIARVVNLLFAGAMYGFVILTGCRTAVITMAATTIFFLFVLIRKKIRLREICKLIVALMIVGIISIPVDYLAVRYVPTIHLHPIYFGTEWDYWFKVKSGDPRDSDKYVSFDEMVENNISGRLVEPLNVSKYIPIEFLVPTINAYAAESIYSEDDYIIQQDGNTSSYNIRYQIYKWYFERLNFIGHSRADNGAPIILGYVAPHAHNWLLQLSFDFGIIVGVMLLAGVVLYYISIWHKLTNGETEKACIMGCFITMFIVFGSFEIDYSLGQLPFTLFFFLFLFVVEKDENNDKIISNDLNSLKYKQYKILN